MERSNFRDEINRIKDVSWSNPLKVCELQHYYTGTFCFAFGPEFGCGGKVGMTRGESFSLSGKFGFQGAEVSASATFTSSTTWEKTSKPCEWCKPEICYINSILEVWECESFIDWYSWKSEFVRFTPGRARIYPNCQTDNEKCDCNETAAFQQSDALGFINGNDENTLTVSVKTSEFRKKYGTKPANPKNDAKQASSLVEGFLNGPGNQFCDNNVELVVELPNGRFHRVSGPNPSKGLALLSKENINNKNYIQIQKNILLPVLAVGPFAENPDARVKLIRNTNNVETILYEEEALVEVGKLSTIWKELQLNNIELVPGEKLKLVVELVDNTGGIIASVCENVKMPYFPQA